MKTLPITNQVNNYQTNFTSKFKFVSREQFNNKVEETKTKQQVKYVDNYGYSYKVLRENQSAYTDSAASCVVYGLNNTKYNYGILGHYNQYPEQILFELRDDNKEENHDKAFMIGGYRFGESEFYENVLAKCKKKNIKTTVFYGQDSWLSATDVLYDRPNDTVYVAPHEDIKNAEDLKGYYSTIEVTDGDEVFINNEKVNL